MAKERISRLVSILVRCRRSYSPVILRVFFLSDCCRMLDLTSTTTTSMILTDRKLESLRKTLPSKGLYRTLAQRKETTTQLALSCLASSRRHCIIMQLLEAWLNKCIMLLSKQMAACSNALAQIQKCKVFLIA